MYVSHCQRFSLRAFFWLRVRWVFAFLNPYDLGRASCVCRKWRYTILKPVFWRTVCLKAWQLSGVVENYQTLQLKYEGSWRKMWLLRPMVRTDGLYVSRNTYIRAGVTEWTVSDAVHLVCYFRYIRFYPSGRFLYKVIITLWLANGKRRPNHILCYTMRPLRSSGSDGNLQHQLFIGRHAS